MSDLNSIRYRLKSWIVILREIPAEIRTAWKKLTDMSESDDIDVGRDVSLNNKKKKFRPGTLFLFIAILWLVWRYVS